MLERIALERSAFFGQSDVCKKLSAFFKLLTSPDTVNEMLVSCREKSNVTCQGCPTSMDDEVLHLHIFNREVATTNLRYSFLCSTHINNHIPQQPCHPH